MYLSNPYNIIPMIEEVLRRFNPWWKGNYSAPGVSRARYLDEISRLMGQGRMVILFGLRRVGKTTIMRQHIARLLEKLPPERIMFASMDHTGLERTPLDEILREYRQMHGLKGSDVVYLFLDEIQTRPNFENELKSLHDLEERVNIVASGSSSLVVKHKSAALTGRFRTVKVEPLDFGEYLAFKGEHIDPAEPQYMERLADDYLRVGGMPEYVLHGDLGYITDLTANVISRDISFVYGIKEPKLLNDLYFLLMCRVGKKVSFSKLSRLVDVGDDAIKRYVGYLEEAFLLTLVEQDGTPNERKYGLKKCYAPDTGICSVISGLADTGPLAENAVYLKLARNSEPRFFDRGGAEIDFLCGGKAYEVKYKKKLGENDMQSIEGLNKRGIHEKMLVSRTEKSDKMPIKISPLWEFLLS
jgi:predicted AAA+ superfamily ATPase